VTDVVEVHIDRPFIVPVNSIVESIKERPVEIPIVHQEIKEEKVIEEKVVAVERRDTQIKEVTVNRDRYIEKEKLIVKEDIRNYIQTQIKEIQCIQDKVVPVITNNERIVEVPYLLEKIVEKITILPQVVEVIKYVHEIVEEASLGVEVNVDIEVQQTKYRELYVQLRNNFEVVLIELRKLRTANPNLKVVIEIIEKYMVELNGLIEFPRFVPIDRQVEVVRPVLVPTKDQESLREELALAVLVEKLIGEIRTIKTSNPSLKLSLDADLQLLFFSEAFVSHGKVSEDLNKQLNEYLATYRSKTSPNDRDVFIKSILDDRFALANTVKRANLEIEKIKAIAASRQDQTVRLTQTLNELRPRIKNLENDVSVVTKSFQSTNPSLAKELSRLVEATVDIRRLIDVDPATIRQTETVFVLGDIHGTEEGFIRLESAFRALEEENSRLRNHYVRWQKEIPNASILVDKEKII
jgi:hypothetical protein